MTGKILCGFQGRSLDLDGKLFQSSHYLLFGIKLWIGVASTSRHEIPNQLQWGMFHANEGEFRFTFS